MTRKIRQSNVELMRIAAICGVVVLHFNGLGGLDAVQPGSVNEWLLLGMESLCICAVDLFLLISGFFLCRTGKRRIVKALELVLQVMIIGLGRYLLGCFLGGNGFRFSAMVRAMIPDNYFVTMYVALYFLSPYINPVLERLSNRQFRNLLVLWLGLFSLWPTAADIFCEMVGTEFIGIYPGGIAGSQHGYSIVNFISMYLIGACLYRFEDRIHSVSPGKLAAGMALCVTVLTLLQHGFPQIARSYCNPLVIAMAVLVFLLLYRVKLQSGIINTLAKSALTCFLVHDYLLPHLILESVVRGNVLVLLGYMLLTAVGMYLLCWVVWLVYETLTKPLVRRISKWTEKGDSAVSL